MSSSDGCLHLAEMYVGESGRDNEYGRRSAVIECLACGALRLDDEAVRQDDDLYARSDGTPYTAPPIWLVDPGDLTTAPVTYAGDVLTVDTGDVYDVVILLADHFRILADVTAYALELGERAGRGQLAAIEAAETLRAKIRQSREANNV